MNSVKLFFMAFALCLLTGCMNYNFSGRSIQQGNLLPEGKINKLQIGQSKTRVHQIMGTSLVTTLFSHNRWDYVYTYQQPNKQVEIKSLSLYFKDGLLSKIDRH